jgi:hypothetical protein
MTLHDALKRLALSLGLAASMSLGACATKGGGSIAARPAAAPVAAAPSSDLGDSQLRDAIGLLYRGDPDAARKLLIQVLKRRPGDPTATSLIRQIDADPETLLGAEHFSYRSRPDDSLSSLAARFLGDPILFYALARYNHLSAGGELPAGLMLRIPGRERPEPRIGHPPTEPRSASANAKTAEPHPLATAPPGRNAQRATQLRAAALEQMDRGAIDRAVALFEQASKLDPANTLIQHDLDRALRISRAVHAKT